MPRLFHILLLVLFVFGTSILEVRTRAEEISVAGEAPQLLQKANKWIEDNTKEKVGFSVAGVDVFVHRNITIHDVSYDPDTTVMRIKGHLGYKTGPNAAFPASVGGEFDIKYNFATSDLEGVKIKLKKDPIPEISVDLTPIKEAMEGDVGALLELIPNGGLVERQIWSEYDSRKKYYEDKYGKENVYFASSDFVRWASPETAGKWIVTLVASGGTSSSAIAAEAKTRARKEFTHILRWLEVKAGNQARTAVDSLLNGEPIQLPQLKLVWQVVNYRSKVVIGGQSMPQTPTISHAAFVLVWETPTGPTPTFDPLPRAEVEDNSLRPKWSIGARYAIGPTGCRVVFLKPNGPAEKAGIKLDDVITTLGGSSVGSIDLKTDRLIRVLKSNDQPQLEILYLRSGTTSQGTVTLEPVQ